MFSHKCHFLKQTTKSVGWIFDSLYANTTYKFDSRFKLHSIRSSFFEINVYNIDFPFYATHNSHERMCAMCRWQKENQNQQTKLEHYSNTSTQIMETYDSTESCALHWLHLPQRLLIERANNATPSNNDRIAMKLVIPQSMAFLA